jgi:hypothetical protein
MASRQRGRRVMERVQLVIPDLHTERPSEAFAGHAGAALRAGGALHTAFRDFEAHRPAKVRPVAPPVADAAAGTGSLVIDHDDAALRARAR